MKLSKIASLLMVPVLALSLAACSAPKDDASDAASGDAQIAELVAQKPAGAEEAAELFQQLMQKENEIDPQYVAGGTGTLTPYTGVFCFAAGVLITTPIFNTFAMSHPAQGNKVTMKDYLKGDTRTHLIGMLGGFIWMSGMVVSFMGAGSANPAIAYALSNAAPVVAMIWGFFVWKEFKGAPKGTVPMIATMFVLFVVGLVLITLSN